MCLTSRDLFSTKRERTFKEHSQWKYVATSTSVKYILDHHSSYLVSLHHVTRHPIMQNYDKDITRHHDKVWAQTHVQELCPAAILKASLRWTVEEHCSFIIGGLFLLLHFHAFTSHYTYKKKTAKASQRPRHCNRCYFQPQWCAPRPQKTNQRGALWLLCNKSWCANLVIGHN